jgi:hypothetical protein
MTGDIPTSRTSSRRPAGRGPRVRLAAFASALAVAITGCSSGQPASPAASRTPSGGHASTASTPTGPELAKLLPPHISLPPGWAPSHLHVAYWNRTAKFSKPIAQLGPPLPGANLCTRWSIALSPQDMVYLWEMSFAIAEAIPPHMPGSTSPVVLQLSDFLPGAAARQFAQDVAFARRCRTYHDPANGSKVTITATAVSGLGHQNIYIQLVNPYPFGGSIIHDHSDVLLVLIGNDIIGVGQVGNATNPLDPVVPLADLKEAAQRVIAALTASSSVR